MFRWASAGLFANVTSITIRECEFQGCVGAGFTSDAGSVVVERCLFEGCSGGAASINGVASSTMSASVKDCVLRNNTGNAALQLLEMPIVEISGNVFVGNSSTQNAVALVVNAGGGGGSGNTTVLGNLFAANVGSVNSVGAVSWNSSGEIRGNTFWSNSGA